MTDGERERLSEEEAARLWQRAAQLQAEAALRAEDEAAEEEEVDEGSTALVRDEGYDLEHVRQAAVEAGIGDEFLDAALADLHVERRLAVGKRGGRLARRLLGDPPDAITVTRVIEAPPEAVLRAMEELVPREPYNLTLRERRGDPVDGGLLVFDIQGAGFSVTGGFVGEASHADLREVLATIRPAPGREGGATELTLRGPVAWAQSLNAGIGGVVVAFTGAAGFGISLPVALYAATTLASAGVIAYATIPLIAAGLTATGSGVSASLGLEGFRALYRWSLGKGRKGLEGLVSTIALEAQGGWGLDGSP